MSTLVRAAPLVVASFAAGAVAEILARCARKGMVNGAVNVELTRSQCARLALAVIAINALVLYPLIAMRTSLGVGHGATSDLVAEEVAASIFFYIQPTLWEAISGVLGTPGTATDVVYQ